MAIRNGSGRDLDWHIEETCFNAFPSQRQALFGRWLMRFADGVSRRSNSVNALGPECPDIECPDIECPDIGATIAAAERLYRSRNQPTIFRILSILDPALDAELAARRYTAEGETCVYWCDMANAIGVTGDPAVRLLPEPDAAWLDAMARLQNHTSAQAATYRGIVGAIAVPARFALLAAADDDAARPPAALAYAALHDGMLCYESVIVAPEARRRGLARRIIGALAAWARDAEGATALCLQVQADNTPARALYAEFGLVERYRYHYRRQPAA